MMQKQNIHYIVYCLLPAEHCMCSWKIQPNDPMQPHLVKQHIQWLLFTIRAFLFTFLPPTPSHS